MSAILIVDSVAKSLNGNPVLEGASLRAVQGELRALIGSHGSGKSTLLEIAAGVTRADSGSVYFTGQTYHNMLPGRLANLGLFYIPYKNLFSNAWTVRIQLEMIRVQFNGRNSDEAIELAGLGDCANERPSQLTLPQLRRAEIAAALVRRPRCVLVDDAYRGLADRESAVLTRLFRELAASGVAVVVSGCDAPDLIAAADRVTWCTARKTQEMGTPRFAARSPQFSLECLSGLSKRENASAASGA